MDVKTTSAVQTWKNNCNSAADLTISFLLFCLFPFQLCSKKFFCAQIILRIFCML